VAEQHKGTDEFAEMNFWDGLAEVRAVSNNDALHALLISFGQSQGTFGARLAAARKRGWIAKDRELPANTTAEVGWIAKAVCIEAKIKGGLTMRVFGPKERYAVRELNHLGWLPNMSRTQAISGLKLIGLLSEAEDYIGQTPDRASEDM